MTSTDSTARPQPAGAADPDAGAAGRARRVFARTPVRLAVAGVLVAAAAGGALLVQRGQDGGDARPSTAPVALPGSLGGYESQPDTSDALRQPAWRSKAAAAAPGVTVEGRSYGSPQLRRQIRVVAGRADLTGKLEFAWPADGGTKVGDASCTNNLRVTAQSAPQVRPTMMMCWRTGAALSAYVVVIDFDKHPTAEATAELLTEVRDGVDA